jgi:hypothetical protein
MKNSEDGKKKITIEEIEEKAVRGEDVTQYFNFKDAKKMPGFGKMERVHKDIQRVNVDIAQPMLKELDHVAEDLNVPRQSAIKALLRDGLDQYYIKSQARKAK